MRILTSVFAIVLGAVLGSFANVLVIRMKEGESIGGRSRCVSCRRTLRPSELIPIVSWFALRGKCSSCGKRIHWQYPAVEAVMAILSFIAFSRAPEFFDARAAAIVGFEIALSFVLLVIAAFDLRWQLVPVDFVLWSAVILSGWRIALGVPWVGLVIGAAVISGSLGLIVIGSRGRLMGEGDPYVGLLMGAVLGFPLAVYGVLASFVLGGSIAAALLIERAVTRKTAIPFVPFLAAGTLVALWYREPLLLLSRYVAAF
jgi:prepilin signal peptidase PulO-like enzyme (type II secretory pathway)